MRVTNELPPKIEAIRYCLLSEEQIELYQYVLEQVSPLIQVLKDADKSVPYIHVFAVLNYLKQICNHPSLFKCELRDYSKYSSGKWDLFMQLLDESLGSGRKVVVFSQYAKMLDLIESYLKDRAILFATMKGLIRNRVDGFRRFNHEPNCMVFTAWLKRARHDIDLTGGSVVIHYDRWWNSDLEERADKCVHRIGQKRCVQVYKLVTRNTLEEKFDAIIARRRHLMNSDVKQDNKTLLKRFSRADLAELMSF